MYTEVRINFYDDIDECWSVDAWKTSNPNEEGQVVAKIYDDTSVVWTVPDAKTDPLVTESISQFLQEEYNI